MKRRLLFLNIGLGLLLVAGLAEWIRQLRASEERYAILAPEQASARVPALPDAEASGRTRPAAFLPIVDSMLFSPDRNADVVVEEPEPAPVIRPDLPRLVGVMDLGRGPIALMSETAEGSAVPVIVGEQIGEFTLVAADAETITLNWRGTRIEARHAELTGRTDVPSSRASRRGETLTSRPASARRSASLNNPDGDQRERPGGQYNIGPELSGVKGVYRADPRDKSPAGTEYQGYVKRVRETPFGKQAWWEKKPEGN